jgi:hypothetical protein
MPTLVCVTDPQAMKAKLFGSGAVGIPPTYLELLLKRQADEWEVFVVFRDYATEEFRAYWLDGQLFRGITYSGKENDDASAHELAYPLSTVSSVKTTYTLFEYDEFTRRHERWTRRVTVQFRDEEPIVLENVREDSKDSRFVDAILEALAKAS